MLKGQKCFVFGKKCFKAGFIAGVRRDGCTAGPGKNGVRKEILQGLAAFPANHIGGKQCHAPWTALSCGLHNGYRGVHGSGENPLTHLVEVVEVPGKRWYLGTQYHPEYSSTVLSPNPLFLSFVDAAINYGEENH